MFEFVGTWLGLTNSIYSIILLIFHVVDDDICCVPEDPKYYIRWSTFTLFYLIENDNNHLAWGVIMSKSFSEEKYSNCLMKIVFDEFKRKGSNFKIFHNYSIWLNIFKDSNNYSIADYQKTHIKLNCNTNNRKSICWHKKSVK